MSESIPACISIGGKVRANLAPQLCKAIAVEGVALEWGDGHFRPKSPHELLEARREIDGTPVLWLCDDQANWGRFAALEAFLVKHGIAFNCQSDGKGEFSPDLIVFRPGFGPVRIMTSTGGEPVITAKSMEPVKTGLHAAITAGKRADLQECLSQLEVAQTALHAALPPAIRPLPPFEVG